MLLMRDRRCATNESDGSSSLLPLPDTLRARLGLKYQRPQQLRQLMCTYWEASTASAALRNPAGDVS